MSFMSKSKEKRFNLSFGQKDGEAEEWFFAHSDKSAYLKALILEDMERSGAFAKEGEFRGEAKDAAVLPAVQPAGRGH